jgi:hypothetical protein
MTKPRAIGPRDQKGSGLAAGTLPRGTKGPSPDRAPLNANSRLPIAETGAPPARPVVAACGQSGRDNDGSSRPPAPTAQAGIGKNLVAQTNTCRARPRGGSMNPMNPPSPTWAPVIASGIVGLCSLIGIWLAQRTTTRREHAAKEKEAKEKRANRWDDFQMRTLLDLQDALKQLTILPGKKRRAMVTHMGILQPEAIKAFTREDADRANQRSDQLFDELATTRYNVVVLSARVPDPRLAEVVAELVALALACSKDVETLEEVSELMEQKNKFRNRSMESLGEVFDRANRRIGELLADLRPDHP